MPVASLPVLANKLRLSFSNHLGTVRAVPSPFSLSLWLDTGYIDYFIIVFPNLKFICQNELSKAQNKRQGTNGEEGKHSFDGKLIFPHASDYGFAAFFAKIALAKLSK